MIHRHAEIPPDTSARALPRVALVDLLERGDLQAWLPLARAIQGDPTGELAITVMRLIDAYPMYGTSALWRAWIDLCQARAPVGTRPASLASLRRQRGLTQAQVAVRLGMSQSDVSKLERRQDLRLSTLQAYARALGGRLQPVFVADENGKRIPIAIPQA